MQQTGVNLLPAVFHFYFLTVRLLYFNMFRFRSSVTGNCIMCYVSRSRARSWRRWFILFTGEATSGIACTVLGFGTQKEDVDKLDGLWRGAYNEDSMCVGLGLFSLKGKNKTLEWPNCPLPPSECREETVRLSLHIHHERREGSK